MDDLSVCADSITVLRGALYGFPFFSIRWCSSLIWPYLGSAVCVPKPFVNLGPACQNLLGALLVDRNIWTTSDDVYGDAFGLGFAATNSTEMEVGVVGYDTCGMTKLHWTEFNWSQMKIRLIRNGIFFFNTSSSNWHAPVAKLVTMMIYWKLLSNHVKSWHCIMILLKNWTMYVIEQTNFIPTKTKRIAKIDNNRTELAVAILHPYSQILLSKVAINFF